MTSDSPPVPPPDHVEAFVKWMLRYGRDFAQFREPHLHNLDRFIELNWKSVNQEITERSLFSADALMTRGSELSQWYTDNLQKLVDGKGGITSCPRDVQTLAIIILVKVEVMLRLAKHKYQAPIPDDIVGPL